MTKPPSRPGQGSGPRLLFMALLCCVLAVSGEAATRPRELLLGIEPEHNIFTQMENYRKLASYLSSKTGFPVRFTIMSRYGEVLERFKNLHLDGALLNSYTATLAIDNLDLAPLVRPVKLAGEPFSRSLILTRRDSGISQVGDMRGKRFAFVDPATTEGYLFPQAYLREHGVGNPERFLGHAFFTGSHASTISAVLDGRAELGAAKEEVYAKQIAKDPASAKELVIIAGSEPMPPATLLLKNDLPPETSRQLREILLNMATSAEGSEVLRAIGAVRFTQATSQDYDIVRKMLKETGLNREHVAKE